MDRIAGIVLAGGRSRRMGGGDKCLLPLGGRPLLAHVVARVAPQVAALALSAAGDPRRFRAFGLPVVADDVPGFAGPLAGILAGMDWAASRHPDIPLLASFPCDAPFVPLDLVARLAEALGTGAQAACARSEGRIHFTHGLWPIACRDDLRQMLSGENERRVEAWTARLGLAVVDFSARPLDPFLNVNRPEDLAAAERIIAGS